MALIPSARYPSQIDTSDPAYPQGKARNAGTFQDGTGTPLEKDHLNDTWGFHQALLDSAGISPSGDPDEVGASQYLDAVEHLCALAANAEVSKKMLRTRLTGSNLAFTDTGSTMAVISGLLAHNPILAIKAGANDVHRIFDGDDCDGPSAVASITSAVTGVARNGSRLVAIGSGGNRCCFSTNEGSGWSGGSDLGATPQVILYNATHSRFMVSFSAGVNVAQDVDGASTWAAVSTGLTNAQGGLAHLSDGTTVAAGLDVAGDVDFARSTDGGATWSIAGGTLPSPNSGDFDPGWIAGNGGSTLYHASRVASGAELRICSSADGLTWVPVTTFLPTGTSWSRQPRLLMCQDTGLLVALAAQNGVTTAFSSPDGGGTWTAPVYLFGSALESFGIARGRLFSTRSSRLYASDPLPAPP